MKQNKSLPDTGPRNRKILKLYREGKTLQEIGTIYSFTRSRSQQIVISELKKEILKGLDIKNSLTYQEGKLLDSAAKEELHNIYLKNKNNRFQIKNKNKRKRIEEIKMSMAKLPDVSHFITVTDYYRALKIKRSELKEYFPEIVTAIVSRQKKRWSRFYNQCRNCGTTTTKHAAHGLCWDCYVKSDIYKRMQEASRLRNISKWRARQNEYAKKYQKRPEVIKKMKKERDEQYFGGNREVALKRDNYRCQSCSTTQEESLKKLKRDLYVVHIKDKDNQKLENLLTLCRKCHNVRMMKIMRKKLASSRGR